MKVKSIKKLGLTKTSIVNLNELHELKGGYSTWSGSKGPTTSDGAANPCCNLH